MAGGALFLLATVSPSANGFFSKSGRGRDGPALLKLDTGVRALSLGGAYVGVADDAGAVFWNPAGLQQVHRDELLLGQARLFEDQTRHDLGWAHPSWRRGERETWGVSASYLTMDPFDLVNDGSPAGSARPWEGAVGVSYARPFRDIAWGITGKTAQKEFPGASGRSYLMDAGVMGKAKTLGADWGIAVANLGTPMALGDEKLQSPLVVRVGGSRQFYTGTRNRLLVTMQLDAPRNDVSLGRVGAEYVIPVKEWSVAFRAGAQTAGESRWAAGFGVSGGFLGMNYAYAPSDKLGASQRVDMVFRFGRPLDREVKRRALFDEAQTAWNQGQAAKTADILEEIEMFSPAFYPAVQLSKDVNRRIEESLKPETLFNLGMHAYSQNDFEHAADYFRKLALLDPHYPEAADLLKKSDAKRTAEREARDREELKRGREMERRAGDRSARDDQRGERWAPALRGWRKVLARFPNDKEAAAGTAFCRGQIRGLADQSERSGDREKAAAYFSILQEDSPDPDLARHIDQLIKSVCIEHAARAQELYRKGIHVYDAGDLKSALPLFEEAARLAPDDSAIAHARDRVRAELEPPAAGKPIPAPSFSSPDVKPK